MEANEQGKVMWADQGLKKVLELLPPKSRVLDWGCGVTTPHRKAFEDAGHIWTGFDIQGGWKGDTSNGPGYYINRAKYKFGLVWASHVLEHCFNPVEMLADFRQCVPANGLLAVTVPPLKHEIVGGHINLYNAGLLLYQLVLAGWDCSKARVKSYGYNITAIVSAESAVPLELIQLKRDAGDIELLAQYFPPQCRKQGFDGRIAELNWDA